MIRRVTSSSYSHAALVVSEGVWFEATGEGLGFRAVFPTHLDEPTLEPLLDVSSHGAFDVYRHPDVARLLTEDRQAFEAKVKTAIEPLVGMNYASTEVFLGFIQGLDRVVPARFLARLVDLLRDGTLRDPGPFCSALIPVVFEELGLDLLQQPKPLIRVSPGDLADSALSRLRRVQEAVGPADPIEDETLNEFRQFDDVCLVPPLGPLRASLLDKAAAVHPSEGSSLLSPTEIAERITAAIEKLRLLDKIVDLQLDLASFDELSDSRRKRLFDMFQRLKTVTLQPIGPRGLAAYQIAAAVDQERAKKGVAGDSARDMEGLLILNAEFNRVRLTILDKVDRGLRTTLSREP